MNWPRGRKHLPSQVRRGDPFSQETSAVTKKEIVRTISEEIGLTQLQTKEIVQKTFNAIVEALVEERRIELRNFGVFEVKRRAPRKARNPRTGDKVFVPEKFVVTFKPGKEMEERVRELEIRAAAAAKAGRTKTAPADCPSRSRPGAPRRLDGLRLAARGIVIAPAARFRLPTRALLVPLVFLFSSTQYFSLRSVSRRRFVCA